jgi:hypothetical protein
MGDFGRNIFTPLVKTVKRVAKVAVTPVTIVRKVTQGNIKGAVKDSLDLNPIVLVAKAVSGKENIVNMARLSMPTSVANISDKDLRKKALIGYAAAAAVATAVFAVTAASTAAATTAATGTGAGAAGTAAGAAGAIGTATKVLDITGRVAGMVGKKKPGEPGYEEEITDTEQNQFLAGMVTPQNILLFMGLSALTVAGYLLFNKPMKSMKRR